MNEEAPGNGVAARHDSPWHAAQTGIVLLGCLALCAPVAYWAQGGIGLAAAGIAAFVCAAASVAAFAVGRALAFAPPPTDLLASMVVRMALPMIVLVAVQFADGALVDVGWGFYLIGFYLVALAADTRRATGQIARGQIASDLPSSRSA